MLEKIAQKGKPLRMPKGAAVRSALLAAGGDRLLVLYGDATLAFWDTRTGALLGQTKYFADPLAVQAPPLRAKLEQPQITRVIYP